MLKYLTDYNPPAEHHHYAGSLNLDRHSVDDHQGSAHPGLLLHHGLLGGGGPGVHGPLLAVLHPVRHPHVLDAAQRGSFPPQRVSAIYCFTPKLCSFFS